LSSEFCRHCQLLIESIDSALLRVVLAANKPSLEGSSRISTAGSGATIGWAGPWVVSHRTGGADRMYPASQLRAKKHSKRLQAPTDRALQATIPGNLPHDAPANQDTVPQQALQDMTWTVPPQNPAAVQPQMLAATIPSIPNQTHSKLNGVSTPVMHASPQQSRIPSPTKSIPKGLTATSTTSMQESHTHEGRFRNPPDALHSQRTIPLPSGSKKKAGVASHAFEVSQLIMATSSPAVQEYGKNRGRIAKITAFCSQSFWCNS
jgi:hypothetical protein